MQEVADRLLLREMDRYASELDLYTTTMEQLGLLKVMKNAKNLHHDPNSHRAGDPMHKEELDPTLFSL